MSATDRSPGTATPAPAPGRRERRKRTTRQALEEAALVLFARDGFDATTVEAIAERAEVSPRTFFRYFAAKEEVLDMGWAERRERLARLVREAPADADDLTAAVHALEGIAVDFEAERHRVTLRAAAVATSSALRGRTTDTLTAWEAALARGLSASGPARRGPVRRRRVDPRPTRPAAYPCASCCSAPPPASAPTEPVPRRGCQLTVVVPLQVYLVLPSGTNLPPLTWISRKHSPVRLGPTR